MSSDNATTSTCVPATVNTSTAASSSPSISTVTAGSSPLGGSVLCSITQLESDRSLDHPGANRTSHLWKHFFVVDPKKNKGFEGAHAFCRYLGCGRCVPAGKDGTNAMKSHIKTDHKDVYTQILVEEERSKAKKAGGKNKQPSMAKFATKRQSKEERKTNLVHAGTSWVIEEGLPFNTVDKKSFRFMLNVIDENCPIMTSENIRDDVIKLRYSSKEAIKRELKGKYFATTTDHWTSRKGDNFCALTAHYISDGVLHRCLLAFEVHHGRSTGERIGESFVGQFEEYGLDLSYCVACVTDSTGNMNTFGKYLERKGVEHIYCVDHVLHLNAKHAYDDKNLPGLDSAMKEARSLVEAFSKSTQAMAKLLDVQATIPEYNGETPKKVLQDVVTRWWSTYRMLKRLRILRTAIETLIASKEFDGHSLTELQWKILKETEKLLETMAGAQRLLEGEQYPTTPFVPYFISKIRKEFKHAMEDDTKEAPTRHLAKVLYEDFVKRYFDEETTVYTGKTRFGYMNRQRGIHPLVVLTSCVDPRMKQLPFIPRQEHDYIWKEIQKRMTDIAVAKDEAATAAAAAADEASDAPPSQSNAHQDPASPNKKARTRAMELSLFDDLRNFDQMEAAPACLSPEERRQTLVNACAEELLKYRRLTPITLAGDPLKWWELNKEKFPYLYLLSLRLLCIPATSAPSERVFSLASRIITYRRSSLDPEIVSKLIFLKQNKRVLVRWWHAINGYYRTIPGWYGEEVEEKEEEIDAGDVACFVRA